MVASRSRARGATYVEAMVLIALVLAGITTAVVLLGDGILIGTRCQVAAFFGGSACGGGATPLAKAPVDGRPLGDDASELGGATGLASNAAMVCDKMGCKGGGNCFAAGTRVATPAGPVPIETLHEGDLVLARDPESSGTAAHAITATKSTNDREVLAVEIDRDGAAPEIVRVTPEHPFFVVGRGWQGAGWLEAGDHLVTADGADARVGGIATLAARTTVFNVEVEGLHTYFVGESRALVHNDCLTPAELAALQKSAESASPDAREGLRLLKADQNDARLKAIFDNHQQVTKARGADAGARFLEGELTRVARDHNAWKLDVAGRRADVERLYTEMLDFNKQTEGKYYGTMTREEWKAKQGAPPTSENALVRETKTGLPTVGESGSPTWHGPKLEARLKQLQKTIAELRKIRESVDPKALGEPVVEKMDKMLRQMEERRRVVQGALDDWNARSQKLPAVWDENGQSRTVKNPAHQFDPKKGGAVGAPVPVEEPLAVAKPPPPKVDVKPAAAAPPVIRPGPPSLFAQRGRTALVGFMKDTGAGVRGLNRSLSVSGTNGGAGMAVGNTTVVFAQAVMVIAQIVDQYHREHFRELVDLNDAAFRKEFDAWLERGLKADNRRPEDADDVIRGIGRSVVIHFYDPAELKKALDERWKAKDRNDPSLEANQMEREAGRRYLELRFLEETGWKPRWSYMTRQVAPRWYKHPIEKGIAFDELVYTAPNGQKTVTVRRDGKEYKMTIPQYEAMAKRDDFTVREEHRYDTPAPKVPDLGMKVVDLPKVPVIRSEEVDGALEKALEMTKPYARVEEMYLRILGRKEPPTEAEVKGHLDSGATLEKIRENIGNSPEARANVERVIGEVLLRKATPEELRVAGVLFSKGMSLEKYEARAKTTTEAGYVGNVMHYLQSYLGIEKPDAAEVRKWVDLLMKKVPDAEVRKRIFDAHGVPADSPLRR